MKLAAPFAGLCGAFEAFFKEWPGHNRSKLLWCPTVGTVHLTSRRPTVGFARGFGGPGGAGGEEVEVVVSTPQACALLLFTANRPALKLDEIAAELGLTAQAYLQFYEFADIQL